MCQMSLNHPFDVLPQTLLRLKVSRTQSSVIPEKLLMWLVSYGKDNRPATSGSIQFEGTLSYKAVMVSEKRFVKGDLQ